MPRLGLSGSISVTDSPAATHLQAVVCVEKSWVLCPFYSLQGLPKAHGIIDSNRTLSFASDVENKQKPSSVAKNAVVPRLVHPRQRWLQISNRGGFRWGPPSSLVVHAFWSLSYPQKFWEFSLVRVHNTRTRAWT